MAQVQCPNCGGYKVNQVSVVGLNANTRGVLLKSILLTLLAPGFILLLAWGADWAVGDNGLDNLAVWLVGHPWVLAAATVVLFFTFLSGFDNQARAKATLKRYRFACELCGYHWDWTNNTPWPQVQVRPDLIAAGAQRLKEEADQRQRDMEAAAWLAQQRRSK